MLRDDQAKEQVKKEGFEQTIVALFRLTPKPY